METETPETNACYARAGMMLAAQVDELDATCQKLEIERNRLRSAMKEIVACGLNCKDALDEAEQMERIAKEALSPANAASEPQRKGDSDAN